MLFSFSLLFPPLSNKKVFHFFYLKILSPADIKSYENSTESQMYKTHSFILVLNSMLSLHVFNLLDWKFLDVFSSTIKIRVLEKLR